MTSEKKERKKNKKRNKRKKAIGTCFILKRHALYFVSTFFGPSGGTVNHDLNSSTLCFHLALNSPSLSKDICLRPASHGRITVPNSCLILLFRKS